MSFYGVAHGDIVLQLFLSSPKSSLRFAATRTLASLALSHPTSVAACNVDLENLISDQNRSVATYAITTLLKVCGFLKGCTIGMCSLKVTLDRKRGVCGPPNEADIWLYE